MQNTLTITIPQRLTKQEELIVIPRKEYERLRQRLQKNEFIPSPAQKRALLRAEYNLRQGKTFSYHELISKLGLAH